MLTRTGASLTLGCLVAVLNVCACSSATPDGAAVDVAESREEAEKGSSSFVLLPGGRGVASACAAELGATYCSEAAATDAAKTCEAKLDDRTIRNCENDTCMPVHEVHATTCSAGATYPTTASCDEPVDDTCSFYRSCLDAAHPCGEKGYAIAYGERLCNEFVRQASKFTPAGQAWLHGVRSCLQRALVPVMKEVRDGELTCEGVVNRAFDSHPECYTTPGNSVCSLTRRDRNALKDIIGGDLFSERSVVQIGAVVQTCALNELGFDVVRTPPSRR